jgi:hypothetical protein
VDAPDAAAHVSEALQADGESGIDESARQRSQGCALERLAHHAVVIKKLTLEKRRFRNGLFAYKSAA